MMLAKCFDGSVALVWAFNFFVIVSAGCERCIWDGMDALYRCIADDAYIALWTRFRLVGCYSSRAPSCKLSDARVVSTDFSIERKR